MSGGGSAPRKHTVKAGLPVRLSTPFVIQEMGIIKHGGTTMTPKITTLLPLPVPLQQLQPPQRIPVPQTATHPANACGFDLP